MRAVTQSVKCTLAGGLAAASLLLSAPLALAYSDYDYQGERPVAIDVGGYDAVAVGPVGEGAVYLEAVFDPYSGQYVYPERIRVWSDKTGRPVSYRVKRVIYPGEPVYGPGR